MTQFTIKTETTEEFFKRGRQWAKAADQGKRLPQVRGISFEDPVEMMQLVTATRLALFRAVRDMPGSITEIAQRLHRDRSAVKRDVDELARAGLVTVSEKPLPGHGRMKEVRATAQRFRLMAEIG
ncbi:MAG: MarR family transcriptional regulator [Burkholderiaceae bacterium]|jgi:predicted transcriptional regulator|nr:MarR family transcriptional regulator [Burkholderiaceae bacterium]